MTGLDTRNETTAHHEWLETELLAQDRNAARVSMADVDETTARQLVNDSLVSAVAADRVLVHKPTGETSDAIRQLAVFHQGWTAVQTPARKTNDVADALWLCVL